MFATLSYLSTFFPFAFTSPLWTVWLADWWKGWVVWMNGLSTTAEEGEPVVDSPSDGAHVPGMEGELALVYCNRYTHSSQRSISC